MTRKQAVVFECSVCGELFDSTDRLHEHDPSLCAYMAAGRDLMTRRAVSFVCSTCGESFDDADAVKKHAAACSPHASQEDEASGRLPAMVGQPVWVSASRSFTNPPPPALPLPHGPTRRRASRQGLARSLSARRVLALAAAAVLLMIAAGPVLAWFRASATVQARISTGTWTSGELEFGGGCSKAVRYTSSGCSHLIPVAETGAAGVIRLDFGDVAPGTTQTWWDVLRATSNAHAPAQVAFTTNGAMTPLVQSAFFVGASSPDILDPGQTRSTGLRVVVPKRAAPGTYAGMLVVTVLGSGERHEFPMTIRILSLKHHGPGHKPGPRRPDRPDKPATQPSRPPSPSPSTSPPPNPSCSPTTAPEPSVSPSSAPEPSVSPSSAPEPSVSPSSAPTVTLTPGESKALSDPESPQVPVARQHTDGALALAFGTMPLGRAFVFPDVLRLSSTGTEAARVSISLSGPVADAVRVVGFWDGERGVVCDDLQLQPGTSASIAFAFAPDASAPEGLREGTLTIVVTTSDGSTLQWELPLAVLFVAADDVPSDPASPEPAVTPVTASDRVPLFSLG